MRKRFTLIFISLIISFVVFAQEKPADVKPETTADTTVIKAIPLANLSDALAKAQKELKFLKEQTLGFSAFSNFDSLYDIGKARIDREKQQLALNEKQFGQREINDALKEWKNYENRINDWLSRASDYLTTIEANLNETQKMLKTWNLTSNQLREEDINYALRITINDIVKEIKATQKEIRQKQDDILIKQDKLNNLIFDVNDVIFSLQNEEKQIKTEYFLRASVPLWKLNETSKESISISKSFQDAIQRHQRNFSIFFIAYQQKFALHFFLFILLLIGLNYLNKNFILQPDEKQTLYLNSKEVVSKYFLSTLVVAILLSIWLYPARQTAVDDLLQLALLLLSFAYLTQGMRIIRLFLFFTLLLFVFDQAQVFFNGDLLVTRPALFLESIFSGWILFMLIKPGSRIKQELLTRQWKFIIQTVPFLLFFSVISIFANIFGYTNLASLLTGTSTNSIFNAINIVLATLVVRSIIIGILRSSLSQFSNLIKNKGVEIEKKVLSAIHFLALLIWIKSILLNLTIYGYIYDWIAGLFKLSFTLGGTEIVLGNFFSFAVVIVLTVYITKFVKLILEEELFPRIILPRGVAGASSMIIGYILAALGGYFAISAAGVDLGKFGLVVGALSVGIGFGLQGVVLNFISGLILAFERPIQIGDTVEIGTLMGEVQSIGVRSSKIKTFDGSEVIIPNGNMISNNLTNWTLSNRKKRYDLPVGVAYGSNPNEVLNLLKKVAIEDPGVLKYPEPWALFDGFGDSALNFRIRIWVPIDIGLQVKSNVAVSIYNELEKAGIEIPFPQQDLHLRSVDNSVQDAMFPGKKAVSKKVIVKPRKKQSD